MTTMIDSEVTEVPKIIRVSHMVGDSHEFDLIEGKTYQHYLDQAGITPAKGEVVTAGGSVVDNLDAVPAPNTVVVVTSAVNNG